MHTPATLLLIGIHREELAFGRFVADALDARDAAVLAIPEGLSGRRPRPDQCFQYATLHRALYLQLLPRLTGHYRLLIDLHTGSDDAGPCADVFCANAGLRGTLAADASIASLPRASRAPRIVSLGADTAEPHARTVIPPEIWNNPAFCYLGLELYLPAGTERCHDARELACRLIRAAARWAETAGAANGPPAPQSLFH